MYAKAVIIVLHVERDGLLLLTVVKYCKLGAVATHFSTRARANVL